MTVFGKSLSEYVRFQKAFLGLILLVGLARLALSLGGVPNSSAKWLSMSVLGLIGLVYYSIKAYTSGFGSYKQLLPLLGIQSVLANSISALGVAVAIFTGKDNIFSAPEYSGGGDGKTWFHVGAHIVGGMILFPLVAWLVGSLIMFVTKKVVPKDRSKLAPKDNDKAAAAGV
jgi:hypothetical protein